TLCVLLLSCPPSLSSFFLPELATSQISALSLHDALPICNCRSFDRRKQRASQRVADCRAESALERLRRKSSVTFSQCLAVGGQSDRKSTRLNSSHRTISYAVFCLKKKNT